MFERGNLIQLEPHDNNDMGEEYEEATEGAPFMVIKDQHNIADKTAWEDFVRAYNGE